MIRFTRSYRGAMVSNIARTAAGLLLALGKVVGVGERRRSRGDPRDGRQPDNPPGAACDDQTVESAPCPRRRPTSDSPAIPIRIEPVFWIVTVFFAFNLSDARLIVVWVAVVLVSLIVHEIGHAIALKVFGEPSSIVLHGFGGVTLSRRRLARTQSIVVSLAGPLAALGLLGIPAYLLRESRYGQDLGFGYRGGFGLWPVLFFAVYVNIWWSVANLLPIRPLDGGNVMTEVIGIDRARIVSAVVGSMAAIWAYFYAEPAFRYAAFFAGFLAFINFSEYRRSKMGAAAPSAFDVEGPDPKSRPAPRQRPSAPPVRRGGRPTTPPVRQAPAPVAEFAGVLDPATAESFAWNLLRNGDAPGAARVLQRTTGSVGPFVRPVVDVALGSDGAIDALAAAYLANPSGPSNLVPATITAEHDDVVALARRLIEAGPAGREAAASIQTHLHYGERFADAAAVGEVVYSAGGAAGAADGLRRGLLLGSRR